MGSSVKAMRRAAPRRNLKRNHDGVVVPIVISDSDEEVGTQRGLKNRSTPTSTPPSNEKWLDGLKTFKQKHEKEIEELKAQHRAELAHQQDAFDRATDAVLEKILKTKSENKKLEAGIVKLDAKKMKLERALEREKLYSAGLEDENKELRKNQPMYNVAIDTRVPRDPRLKSKYRRTESRY